jgi:hypothetical protein
MISAKRLYPLNSSGVSGGSAGCSGSTFFSAPDPGAAEAGATETVAVCGCGCASDAGSGAGAGDPPLAAVDMLRDG